MRKVIVDYRITDEEIHSLKKLNYDVIICPPSNIVYRAVCGHPDILLHPLNKDTFIVHKKMNQSFINKLEKLDYNILLSNQYIESKYPYNIILNALNINNMLVHNLKYTDEVLLNYFSESNRVHVNQGYTKCSTAVVNDNAIITSDIGIANALNKLNFDVLLTQAGDILLPGLDYGFIGGACGLLEPNLIAFFGDLSFYKSGNDILKFLKKHKVTPVFLRKGKLIDRGSLFSLNKKL